MHAALRCAAPLLTFLGLLVTSCDEASEPSRPFQPGVNQQTQRGQENQARESTSVAPRPAYRQLEEGHVGTLSGVVRWSGSVPPAVRVPVRTHTEQCGEERSVETIHVGARGGVEGAVVVLMGIEEGVAPPLGDLTLTFQGCDLTPRIAVTTRGARLHFQNADPILHNLHVRVGRETRLDVGLPALQGSVELGAEAGIHVIVDDAAHPWIESYVYVAQHPYVALTDANGRFQITRVPVGAFQIRVWHPGIAESDDTSSGRPLRSAAIVLTRPISVEEATDTTTDFQLDAASRTNAGAQQ